jgi:hypothetical protein
MGDGQAAVGFDRLPWLADEPQPPKRSSSELLGWAVAALVLVAGTSYWMGANSLREPQAGESTMPLFPQTTVPLPQARRAEPAQPAVSPEPMAGVELVVASPLPVIDELQVPLKTRPAPSPKASEAPTSIKSKPAKAAPLAPWPARVIEGASGRLVRIGAFASSRQAKKGWWAIMHMNPALKRLPALVVPVRSLRNGAVYYRLQMGTTSQAHSEVLCQRMRMIGQSCVVIGTNDDGPEVGP